MAQNFVPASSEYLTSATPITAPPLTVAAWVKLDQLPSDFGDEFTVINICDFDHGAWEGWNLRADDATDALQFNGWDGGGVASSCTSTADVTAGIWEHYCGTCAANYDDYECYLNGGNKGTVTEAQSVFYDIDTLNIGCFTYAGARRDYTDGKIAEVAIWNVILTAAEVAVLAAGYSPLFVRPQSLVFYAPLIRRYNDKIGGLALSAGGTPDVSEHPRIIYPASPIISFPSAAAPPAGINLVPLLMQLARQRRAL